jgi:hypothetical protein
MKWLVRAFDPRDPTIDIPTLTVAAFSLTYLGLAIVNAILGKIDLLVFAGGAVTLTTGAGTVAWGMAKSRQADPVLKQEPKPDV